ncbi:MAG: hydrogenase expression/formation C-terminal domain-containing protein [Aquificota bacterium]|jgi:hypothetical protein
MALMNALPLLGEIKQALVDLLQKGETYMIYSNKLPTTLEDRYFLQDVLGKGEWFMYEKVPHTKTVSFNTLIPGVWISVVFSERDPKEPILEMVEIARQPSIMTIPPEDYQDSFRRFEKDVLTMGEYLHPFSLKVLKAFKKFVQSGEEISLSDPEGLENLTYYLLTEDVIVIENKNQDWKITSTNYPGLWVKWSKENRPLEIFVGDFPHIIKPTDEDIKKGIQLLEERKKKYLPKYQNKMDIPLL